MFALFGFNIVHNEIIIRQVLVKLTVFSGTWRYEYTYRLCNNY